VGITFNYMVEDTVYIDSIFRALSDPIRRDVLDRTAEIELTVNQIALDYDISLAAISKHLKVLHDAGLIRKRKAGRFIYVSVNPNGMQEAAAYLKQYEELWNTRLATSSKGNGS
jgi:DNA-binding transcriptional ArsR family regulator